MVSCANIRGMKLHIIAICICLCLSKIGGKAAMVAHFDFEEGAGTTTSSQVGGWSGTFSGDPQWVTAGLAPVPSGTSAALAFDGAGDWIISDYAGIGGSADRSVSFWVSSNNGTQNAGIVAWGNSATPNGRKWHVRTNDNAANGPQGAIRTEIQGSYEIDGNPLTDGNWHHVVSTYGSAGVFGSGQVSHYIDGVLVSDGQLNTGGDTVLVDTLTSATIDGTTYPVMIGGRHQGSVSSFDGMIDEVRLYDHQLSALEVDGLFQGNGSQDEFAITELELSSDGTAVTLTWRSKPGESYRVESSGDLNELPWFEIIDSLPSDGEMTSFTHDQIPAGTSRLFFRVIEE